MTNKEALLAEAQVEANDLQVNKALEDVGLTGAGVYSLDLAYLIGKASIEVLSSLLVGSISEGGYSISYNQEAVKSRLSYLRGKYGYRAPGPIVRGVNPW